MSETRNPNRTKTIKVEILENNRVKLCFHPTSYFPSQPKFDYAKCTKEISKYMSIRYYIRNLKTYHEKLWNLHFDSDNFYYITLTFDNAIEYKKVLSKFKMFTIYLTRAFGHFEFVRAVEATGQNHFHIHIIVQFDEFPFGLSNREIESVWKFGICKIKLVHDLRGIIQYITKYKEAAINKADGRHTFFPKNAKIIAASQHFGKTINKNNCKELNLTKEQAYKLLDYCKIRFKKEKGSFVRTDGHYYKGNKTNKFRNYCLDKVYIRDLTLEEIILILTS